MKTKQKVIYIFVICCIIATLWIGLMFATEPRAKVHTEETECGKVNGMIIKDVICEKVVFDNSFLNIIMPSYGFVVVILTIAGLCIGMLIVADNTSNQKVYNKK